MPDEWDAEFDPWEIEDAKLLLKGLEDFPLGGSMHGSAKAKHKEQIKKDTTMSSIFPASVHCYDRGSYTHSPELATTVWARIRPQGLTWYAADMEILTPTSIKLFVYSMNDAVFGGVGKVIHKEVVHKLTNAEQILLDKEVLRLYSNAAVAEFDRRKLVAEAAEIDKIRKEMFGI